MGGHRYGKNRTGTLANLAGVVAREHSPEKFLSVHAAFFSIRHDQALDLRDRSIVGKTLDAAGVDGASILSEVDAGWPLEILEKEHTHAVDDHQVFGVPTFIAADQAVFVRLMNRPAGDADLANATIERVLDLAQGWPELNELKHTSVLR